MGIFSSIRNAIFGHARAQQAPQAQQAPAQAPAQAPVQAPAQPGGGIGNVGAAVNATVAAAAAAAPQQPVDVEQVLTRIAQEKGNPNLNWRTSIVDLMKLLDLDSSLTNRKELAAELGYAGEKNGSAEMNIWLQKAVMKELEKNGGIVPAGLKD